MGKEKKSLEKKHSRLFAFYGTAALAVLFLWVLRMGGGLFLHNEYRSQSVQYLVGS